MQKEDTVRKSFLCTAGTAVASWLYFQVVVVEVVVWLHLVVAVVWLHLVVVVAWPRTWNWRRGWQVVDL